MGSLTTSPSATKERAAMLKLKVPDMSCSHCASTVEKAVKSVDPGARVVVDLGSSTVAVESKADENAICDVIRSAGYDNEKLAA
jgi:copper chaperone